MAKKVRTSKIWENSYPAETAAEEFFARLTASDVPIPITNFSDFVQNIFAKGYPEFSFNTWHIHYLCNQFQKVLDEPDSKYMLAVMPRYHLKSSVLGYASSIYRMITSHGEGLYVSYKEELAGIHLFHIKESIRRNELLSKFMRDLTPQSDTTINYMVGKNRSKMYSAGILGVKRGLHTQTICICDDLMGDLQNPMTFTEIEKTIRVFEAELLNIPNKGCPLLVFGTVISEHDLLYKLKEKTQFNKNMVWMPALYPDGEHEVLWEDMYPRAWLENRKIEGGWKAFNTEFLLIPVMSTEAFFNKEQLDTVISSELQNYGVPGY